MFDGIVPPSLYVPTYVVHVCAHTHMYMRWLVLRFFSARFVVVLVFLCYAAAAAVSLAAYRSVQLKWRNHSIRSTLLRIHSHNDRC